MPKAVHSTWDGAAPDRVELDSPFPQLAGSTMLDAPQDMVGPFGFQGMIFIIIWMRHAWKCLRSGRMGYEQLAVLGGLPFQGKGH